MLPGVLHVANLDCLLIPNEKLLEVGTLLAPTPDPLKFNGHRVGVWLPHHLVCKTCYYCDRKAFKRFVLKIQTLRGEVLVKEG
jgi:hypothetical protein